MTRSSNNEIIFVFFSASVVAINVEMFTSCKPFARFLQTIFRLAHHKTHILWAISCEKLTDSKNASEHPFRLYFREGHMMRLSITLISFAPYQHFLTVIYILYIYLSQAASGKRPSFHLPNILYPLKSTARFTIDVYCV